MRDHDFFDLEEDGRSARRGSLLNTSRSKGLNAASTVAEAAVVEVLDKETAAAQAAARAAAMQQQEGQPQGRTAVAASADGITVVWHEGPFIWMRRFSHSCRSRSAAMVVSRDPALGKGAKTADLGTGLGDAVALTEGRTAIAWTADGEVWVRLMKVGERAAPAILASTDGRRLRREITMTAFPDFTGFVVAWSSWGQDGDSWGIFARFFNQEGQPTELEQQVNVGATGSQQHPQLFACTTGARGPAVWATWLNGTIGASHEFYVRRLGSKFFSFGPEVKLDASGALMTGASLMCASGSSTQNPSVVWANGEDRKVNWRTVVEPTSRGGSLPESIVSSASLDNKENGQFLSQRPSAGLKPSIGSKSGAVSGNRSARSRHVHAIPASIQLRAEGDVLALASNDEHGGLSVRLFDMSPVATYPTHQITFGGAKLDRVAYDVTLDQALIICFSHRSGVTCERRHLQSLMEAEMEVVSWWFGVVIFIVIFWFRHECFGSEKSAQGRHWSRPADRTSSLRMTGSMLNRLKARDVLSQDFGNVPRPMWKFNMRKATNAGFASPF